MSEAWLIVCHECVELGSQKAHLGTKHDTPAGGFRFWWDGVAHFSDKPSMLVGDLQSQLGNAMGFVLEDRNGANLYGSDDQAVDLTREPHFFALLPATM